MSPISSTLANGSAYGYRTLAAAAAGAYESIASASGTGSSGTITFSSIPSTYASLQIRLLGNTTTAAGYNFGLRINGSTTIADYYAHNLEANGSSVSCAVFTGSNSYIKCGEVSGNANNFTAAIFDLDNYASTTQKKTIRTFSGFDNNSNGFIQIYSGLYQQNTAITSISVFTTDNWTTTTRVALYGIKGA
jgi:hypothetical protein